MKHPLTIPATRRRSSGVGIVTAIFILVVLAGLGVAMVAMFSSQNQGAALDEQGARAYQAARAGIEWGVYQHTRNNSCAGTVSFALPAASVLSGFVVTVTCTDAPGPAPGLPGVRQIRAEACSATLPATCANAPRGPDFVRRVIEVQL
jgi:MSHA biogenesis protein MshP